MNGHTIVFIQQTQKIEPPIIEFCKEIRLRLNKRSHYRRVYFFQTEGNFFSQTKTLADLIRVAMEDSVRKLVEASLAIAHWDSKEQHV